MKSVQYSKSLEVRKSVDVLVVGGGTAGIAASISASILGAKVLLIESQTCLGGLGTSGLVPVFQTFTDGVNFVAGGVGKLIYDRMIKQNILREDMTFDLERLKILYEDLLKENGVEFIYCTTLIDVIKDKHSIKTAVLNSKSGIYAVDAKTFIDCTGDGDLSYISGAEYFKGDKDGKMMAGTLCTIWNNVDFENFDLAGQEGNIEKAYADGVFTVKDKHLPGMFYSGENLALGNLGHCFGLDGTDERSITDAFIYQRKIMQEYKNYYNGYIKGFERASLVTTAPMMGVRESRRIVCDYMLKVDDFINRASFEDEIGRYCYAIDLHESECSDDANEQFKKEYYTKFRYNKGESYGIPYRSITVKGFDNLLVAGRCIGCDRYMLGSIRVMPGCFITGAAAGAAAYLTSKLNTDIRGFEFSLLKDALNSVMKKAIKTY